MSPFERLLQEAIPTRPANPNRQPWTDTDRDNHWAALCHAVGTPGQPRPHETPAALRPAA